MVIHQFNKLIRNKWVWGAFAILVSVAFCFDDLFTTRENEARAGGDAGTLAGEPVKADVFLSFVDDVRGFGNNRNWQAKSGDVHRQAWENYAAVQVAERDGIVATDAEVQAEIRNNRSFQASGGFSFELYQQTLRANSIAPERYEELLKRQITLMRIGHAVLGSATWVSPMEVNRVVGDMTDTFTVRVAKFSQSKAEADAVKVDDAALKKWYEENRKSLELPERVKIRYVRFDANDKAVQARMQVSEEEVHDLYDSTVDRYTSTDTNGVETVKKFEDVKGEVEKEARRIAAVQFFETNLNFRVYGKKAAAGASRLDEIAKEEGKKVETSDWFTLERNAYHEGFMRRASLICPGAEGFLEAVAELDPDTDDLRYTIVRSDSAVWLVEKAETSAKHTPTFDEAKDVIRPRALRDAREAAFKASVEAVAAKGAAAVEAVKGVSTNIVFSVADLRQGGAAFDDAFAVARAAMKLKKGEVSEFTLTSPGKAVLVVCKDRAPGSAAMVALLRSQIRDELAMLQLRQIPESWRKWNLARMDLETTEMSSMENPESEE